MIVLWGNHLGPRPGLWTRRSGPRTKLSMAIFNSFCLTRIQAVQGKPETNESIRVTCFARNCLNTRLVTEGKARLKISLKQCRFDSTNNHCQIIQRRAGGVTIGLTTNSNCYQKHPMDSRVTLTCKKDIVQPSPPPPQPPSPSEPTAVAREVFHPRHSHSQTDTTSWS